MNASQLVKKLTFAEVNASLAADTRRMMREERVSLQAALQSGDADKIKKAMDEAKRVAEMWGVSL